MTSLSSCETSLNLFPVKIIFVAHFYLIRGDLSEIIFRDQYQLVQRKEQKKAFALLIEFVRIYTETVLEHNDYSAIVSFAYTFLNKSIISNMKATFFTDCIFLRYFYHSFLRYLKTLSLHSYHSFNMISNGAEC